MGDEINVIGCTVEEATNRVDKFIDEAALAGKPSVRIIHGHGMGALRRGLANFFVCASVGGEHSPRSCGTRRRSDHDRGAAGLSRENEEV